MSATTSLEGAALVRQGGTASPEPATPDQPPEHIAAWALKLLGGVQRGQTIEDAREDRTLLTGVVSRDTIFRYGQQHPNWYAALLDAQAGAAADQPVTHKDVVRAHAWDEELRRHQIAMAARRDSDAVAAMRLGAEIRGDVGRGAMVQVTVGVRIDGAAGRGMPPRRTVDAEPVTLDTGAEQAPSATEPLTDAEARPPEPAA